ncbi:MAG: cob(I)yrinic acid a,c-diamide adenosyltransferase [Flavobacteriales bacterium]
MQIYTRTGDDGTTGLFGGGRVRKDALRIEAYGTLDELNAFVGALADFDALPEVDRTLMRQHQADLFTIGSHLATVGEEMQAHLPHLPESRIEEMEAWMDQTSSTLPPLKAFVLPGGHAMVSAAHLCRVVCRRAERRVVALAELETIDPLIPRYLNRLSDVFFVWSRRISMLTNTPEIIWESKD